MRKPFKKNIDTIPMEQAHGGSGKRQLILSNEDDVSSQFQAMTKGYLSSGSEFDWHNHEKIDEFFLVLQGRGIIIFRNMDSIEYNTGDLIYIPADLEHKIEATGDKESQYYFIRMNQYPDNFTEIVIDNNLDIYCQGHNFNNTKYRVRNLFTAYKKMNEVFENKL